jgi:hypothetical protein
MDKVHKLSSYVRVYACMCVGLCLYNGGGGEETSTKAEIQHFQFEAYSNVQT